MEALLRIAPAAAGNQAASRGLLRVQDISPEFKNLSRIVEVTRSDVDFLRSSLIQQGAQNVGKAGVGPSTLSSQAGQIAQLHLDVRNARDSNAATEVELRDASGRVGITEDAIRDLASRCDRYRKEDLETSGKALDRLRVQAESMDIRVEAGKGELHGRVEELWGFIRAMDEDQSAARRAVAEARERLALLADEVTKATRAEAVRAEIGATREILEGRLALQGKELEGSVQEQCKTLAERQAKSLAEINRVVRAVDQRLQTTRKEHQDSQRKYAEKYAEREAKLTAELHSELDYRFDKTLTNITEQVESERIRSEQCWNDSRLDHTRLATRVDCVSACLESLVSQVNSTASTSQSTSELLSHLNQQLNQQQNAQQCKNDKNESVHAHLTCRLEAAICSLGNLEESRDSLEKSHHALRDDCAEVAREFKSHSSVVAQSDQRIRSEFDGLRSEFARSVCAARAELEDSASSLRAELASGASSAQAMVTASRDELLCALGREVAPVKQLLSTQRDGHTEEMQAIREELASAMDKQSRRSQQLDARLDALSACSLSSDEVSCALRAQAEKTAKANAATEARIRSELSLAERRMADLLDESLKRCAEISAGTAEVRAANALERECVQQQLDRVEDLAKRALSESGEAAARAAAASLSPQTHDVGLHAAFVADVRLGLSSLAASIVKVAQCCGFLGGLREGQFEKIGTEPPVVYLPAGHIGLKELIEWEEAGTSLSSRIGRAWAARSSQPLTLFEVLQQKADTACVRMVQAAVKETTGRLAQVQCQDHSKQRDIAPCSVSWVQSGEPCVGAFGAHSRKSRAPVFAPLPSRVAVSTPPVHTSLPEGPATLSARTPIEQEDRVLGSSASVAPEPAETPPDRVPDRPPGPAGLGGPLSRRVTFNATTCAANV